MLVSFKNTKINTSKTVITNPLDYVLSAGEEGFDIIYNLYNQLIITSEINQVNVKYTENYVFYHRPKLLSLEDQIDRFLRENPDFLEHKENYYSEFKIPKRKPDEHGRTRWRKLVNPCPQLKLLQKTICETLKLCGMIPHNAAHGFVEERDFYTNAAIHATSNHIINLDFKDFFDSITEQLVIDKLKLHPLFNVDELGNRLVTKIAQIATYKGTTPQGSPLSPFLSNIVLVEFDYRIRKILNDQEIKTLYTRYADDLSFSSKKSQDIKEIIHKVESVLNEYYPNTIKINYDKTKKITPGQCYITGVKLNQSHQLTVGWKKKLEIKSRIHNLCKKFTVTNGTITEFSPEFDRDELIAEGRSIIGYLSFMHRVEPEYTTQLKLKYSVELDCINVLLTGNSNTNIEDIPFDFLF